jgi:hypothetical protein
MKKHSLYIILLTVLSCIQAFAQTNTFPSSGNVGIGTTSPQAKLHSLGRHLIETNEDNVVTFNNTDNSWQYMEFKRSGTRYYWMGLDNGNDFYLTKEQIGNIVLNPTAGKVVVSGSLQIGNGTGSLHYGSNGVVIKYNSGDRALLELHSPDGANRMVFQSLSSATYLGSLDQKPLLIQNEGGNVGIGTNNPQAKLAVNGDIFSKKVKVTQSGWPDYVFASGYRLRSLSEVEQFIKQQQHLPDVPSATAVEKDGLDLGDNQVTLLKKIEELTLYLIAQNKKLELLQKEVAQLKNRP